VGAAILDITRDSANALAALVRQAAMEGDLTQEGMTFFGRYARVDWALPTQGNAVLRTMWEMAPGEEVPRLMTAFRQSCKDAPMGHPTPFDVVALLQSILPEPLHLTEECDDLAAGLAGGTVGTVVDVFPPSAGPLMSNGQNIRMHLFA
jgi:hypothetical protein